MSRSAILGVAASTIVYGATSAWSREATVPPSPPASNPQVYLDIRTFSYLVMDGDWSSAIQTSIDFIEKVGFKIQMINIYGDLEHTIFFNIECPGIFLQLLC